MANRVGVRLRGLFGSAPLGARRGALQHAAAVDGAPARGARAGLPRLHPAVAPQHRGVLPLGDGEAVRGAPGAPAGARGRMPRPLRE